MKPEEWTKIKNGDKVELGGIVDEVVKVFPPREVTPCDMNLVPIGAPFLDFEIVVNYTTPKGMPVRYASWDGSKCKLK